MKFKTGNTYTDQFRRDALDLLQTSGKNMSQVARELGINVNTLRNWKTRALQNASSSFATSDPNALSAEELFAQNQQLRQENEYLKRQREILKKAASILAEDPQLGLR